MLGCCCFSLIKWSWNCLELFGSSNRFECDFKIELIKNLSALWKNDLHVQYAPSLNSVKTITKTKDHNYVDQSFHMMSLKSYNKNTID